MMKTKNYRQINRLCQFLSNSLYLLELLELDDEEDEEEDDDDDELEDNWSE